MSLMSMKMFANMVHMWYSLRWSHVTGYKFAWWILNLYWLVLMSSSESDYVPNEHEDVDKYGWFAISSETRTRWRRVKTLSQHQVGVNLQSHAQHQLWISTWHIFHEFHKIMPSLSYPVSLVNQNVILVNISHWWLHMAWIMSLMST